MPQGSSAVRPTNGLYLYLLNGRRVKLTFHINLIPTPTEYAEFYTCTLIFERFAIEAEMQ